MEVTKDTILGNILKAPGARDILLKYDLPCLTCPMAAYEIGKLKIGQVAEYYEIELDKLLEELNDL